MHPPLPHVFSGPKPQDVLAFAERERAAQRLSSVPLFTFDYNSFPSLLQRIQLQPDAAFRSSLDAATPPHGQPERERRLD